MKRLALALLLIPSLAIGAGWDETVTSPQPDDTIMINDVSQPDGSKTQYSSLKTLPVPDLVTTQLNTKVSLSGDETINGIKNFTSSPILPEPTTDSQAATKFYVDNNAGGGGGVWGAITGTLSDQGDLNTALLGKVNTTGSESINGVKTFVLPPIVPTPVGGTDAVNKDYADGLSFATTWGTITGTLSNQADLQTALDNKAPALTPDQNYVSDAELTVLQNQSGVNTGDQDLSGFVETTGNETIAGVKTFSSSPIVPTPTASTQASNKSYADTKAPALGADDNYVTDAEKTIIGNTSGVNTGDQDLSGKVSTTGNETIQGIKTFNSSPVVPTPTTDFQSATKKYVDDNVTLDTSQYSTLALTTDHSVTEAELTANANISNFGATSQVVATLPDVTFPLKKVVETEAAQNLVVCPPVGGSIRLDGVFLTTDACAFTETEGTLATLKHSRAASGTWYYNLVSAVGTWAEYNPIYDTTGITFWWRGEAAFDPALDYSAGATTWTPNSGAVIDSAAAYSSPNGLNIPTSNDFVRFLTDVANIVTSEEGRVGFWLRIPSLAADKQVFELNESSSNSFRIYVDSTNNRLNFSHTSDGTSVFSANNSIVENTWQFIEIAWKQSASTRSVRIDGVESGTSSAPFTNFGDGSLYFGDVRSAGGGVHMDHFIVTKDSTKDLYPSRDQVNYDGS